MENTNNNPLIEKAYSQGILVPQERKELNSTKETDSRKTVIFVYRSLKQMHNLFDDEVEHAFGDRVNVIHFHSPADAFGYLISNSNSVDLAISEILFSDIDGIRLLDACKTLYPWLPFIIYCAYDYDERFFKNHAPDFYITVSDDMTELLMAIGKCLEIDMIEDKQKIEPQMTTTQKEFTKGPVTTPEADRTKNVVGLIFLIFIIGIIGYVFRGSTEIGDLIISFVVWFWLICGILKLLKWLF